MKLSNNSIMNGIDGNQWIMTRKNKTKTPFKTPILPTIELLIEKYKNHPRTQFTKSLMPNISNQRLNSYLKEIADLCNIRKNITFLWHAIHLLRLSH